MQFYDQQIYDALLDWGKLGCRTAANGAVLIGHVSHVAPEAWLHELYPPLSQSEISDAEVDCGVSFPESYRHFLLCTNGAKLFSGSIAIFGKRISYVRSGDDVWQPFSIVTPNRVERPREAMTYHLFVGSYKYDGSHICIDTRDGRTFRSARGTIQQMTEWASFQAMLRGEVARLASHFDSTGRRIDADRPTTP